jgi:uncharacterized protein
MPDEEFGLSAAQIRILGSLMEKETTTPEYYPLSLNALVNACNQRSNREPVMTLTEDDVREALHGLEELRLAGPARAADGRVTKYEHWLGEVFNLTRAESALLGVLLLRGAQTPGELRGRSERIYRFDEITDVLAGLQKLMGRTPPLATMLERQPGTKEARYAHLLGGPATVFEGAAQMNAASGVAEGSAMAVEGRLGQLEDEVASLREMVLALQRKVDDLFA